MLRLLAQFIVSAGDELALIYNDVSVLENMHWFVLAGLCALRDRGRQSWWSQCRAAPRVP